jgi:hypothetical protein
MVGQTQMLDQSTLVAHWKAKGLISQSSSSDRRKRRARRSITPRPRTIIWRRCSTAG